MGQRDRDISGRGRTILAVTAAGVAFFALPALAQHVSGNAPAGHSVATRSVSPGRTVSSRPIAPSHPAGHPIRGSQRGGTIHSNTFGASSAPPPSWELPRTVTPHWEIGPNVPVEPNAVQGNRIRGSRVGVGVGYLGFPYYADPTAFVDSGTEDDTAQQAQPSAPVRPDYTPQDPYAEAPYDDGYSPPPRAPYRPEGYPPQNSAATQNAATQSDGLDHPAVTLVFNDGRPPVQVHSYVLTGSSVFVAEHGHQRVIPVTDLDLPATIAQNREAGVDFKLPGSGK